MSTKFEQNISKMLQLATVGCGGNLANKTAFARTAKTVLHEVAGRMGLAAKDYDLKFNPGGPAVSGEVTLHSDTSYVQFSADAKHLGVMVRSCAGRKDYCGGKNNWISWDELKKCDSANAFAKKISHLTPSAPSMAPHASGFATPSMPKSLSLR